MAAKVRRVLQARGGDSGGQAELGVVRHHKRFVVVADADHADGPKTSSRLMRMPALVPVKSVGATK